MMTSRRVLVVEDEVLVRFVTIATLEDAGYSVIEASDGTEALQALAGADVALLVTDVRMPHLDGWTLAERARELHPKLAVLYMTGWSDAEPRPVPGSSVLSKPVMPERLIEAAERLLAA